MHSQQKQLDQIMSLFDKYKQETDKQMTIQVQEKVDLAEEARLKLEKEVGDLKAQMEEMVKELEARDQREVDLNEQIQQKQHDYRLLSDSFYRLKQETEQSDAQQKEHASAMEEKIKTQSLKCEALNSQIAQLQKKLIEAKNEAKVLQVQVDTLKQNLADATAQHQTATELAQTQKQQFILTCSSNQKTIMSMNTKVKMLEAQMKQMNT